MYKLFQADPPCRPEQSGYFGEAQLAFCKGNQSDTFIKGIK